MTTSFTPSRALLSCRERIGRKRIGSAVWLLVLFANLMPTDWAASAGARVADGTPLTDADLAEALEVSTGTISAWRRKLRAAGFITWLVAPDGGGRAFRMAAVSDEIANVKEPKPEKKPETVETESAQRWVQ